MSPHRLLQVSPRHTHLSASMVKNSALPAKRLLPGLIKPLARPLVGPVGGPKTEHLHLPEAFWPNNRPYMIE